MRRAFWKHKEVVKNPESLCGHWNQEFQKEQPLHIEIGMGKGQFLLTLAAENPQINYVGIERYSSVLLRAVEKFQELENEGKALPTSVSSVWMRTICQLYSPRQKYPVST